MNKQAGSYDIRMESLPVFISYPRSGSNWINNIFELYFERPRLRESSGSFLKNRKNKNPIWFHDHDINSSLLLTHNNIMYLYRNPIDVIFSNITAIHKKIIENEIKNEIFLLKNNLLKYLIKTPAKTIIKYENLKSKQYLCEFDKIIKFISPNDSVNKTKLDNIMNIVTKEKFINISKDKKYFNEKMLTKEYEKNRENFKHKYEKLILENIISKELDTFFKSG